MSLIPNLGIAAKKSNDMEGYMHMGKAKAFFAFLKFLLLL